MKKLNVEKWNKLRLALEGKGASYRNDAPLFEAMGVPVFDWRTRSLLKALVSSATAEPERSRRHAESHIELYRGYAAGKYNVKPEDQKAYIGVLEAWDAGKLDPVALANAFAQQTVICNDDVALCHPITIPPEPAAALHTLAARDTSLARREGDSQGSNASWCPL
jgi:hypothetical protein